MDAAFYAMDLTRFVGSQGEASSLQLGSDGTWEISQTYAGLEALYGKGSLLRLRWELEGEEHFLPLSRKYEEDGVGYFEFTEVTAQPTEGDPILVYHRFTLSSEDNLVYSTGTAGAGDVSGLISYIDERLDNYDTFSVSIGGRKYRAEKIENKLWLAQNLEYSFSGLAVGGTGVPTTPAAWYYNNNPDMYGLDGSRKCGYLYNWAAVRSLMETAGLLPTGWRVPTNDDWTSLVTFMGPNDAGKQIKSLDKSANGVWPVNWGGTDKHLLAVHPGGMRNTDGNFVEEGTGAHLWTSTSATEGTAYHRMLMGQSGNFLTAAYDQRYAMSVRLVLDLNTDGSVPEGSGVTKALATKEYVDTNFVKALGGISGLQSVSELPADPASDVMYAVIDE